MLRDIARKIDQGGNYEILIDIREADRDLTFFDINEIVKEMAQHRSAFRNKIAILDRKAHEPKKAKFLELCAKK